MATDWGKIFEKAGRKLVTKTDKNKGAYVPNASQLSAIAAAGIKPSIKRPAEEFKIAVLNDPKIKNIGASFYHALRETDPSRSPEPRMGHAFISSWLNTGDVVVIGNIGKQLFAAKESQVDDVADIGRELAQKVSPESILAKAKKAKGKPPKKPVIRSDFQRNPYVVAGAITRAEGICEMPNCKRELFARDDSTPYLEVHHVVPLGEGGDDSLENAAALCPHCHRELHFGSKRMKLRQELAKYVVSKTDKL